MKKIFLIIILSAAIAKLSIASDQLTNRRSLVNVVMLKRNWPPYVAWQELLHVPESFSHSGLKYELSSVDYDPDTIHAEYMNSEKAILWHKFFNNGGKTVIDQYCIFSRNGLESYIWVNGILQR